MKNGFQMMRILNQMNLVRDVMNHKQIFKDLFTESNLNLKKFFQYKVLSAILIYL